MKIAILHDYFDKRGGGERLILNLARSLKADIYTGFIDYKKTFNTKGIRIKSMGINSRLPRLIRNILIAKSFEKYKFPEYDTFVFSGVWCIAASGNRPSVLYCHTPPRFIYDLRDYFLNKANPITKIILRLFIKYWKPKDQYYMRKFDRICPNSNNVRKRILKYYGKKLYDNCEVVYTGIETNKFYYKKSEGFYLSTSRLDAMKRIDLLINTFKQMPDKKLLITGTGPEERKLKVLAKGCNNIIFLGSINEKELIALYAKCKATISANIDEDLGLSPIESQAAGKPSIVVKEGGFLETVNKKTGVFFKPNITSLKNAIEKLERTIWNKNEIKKSSKRYDINIFTKNMKRVINEVIDK